MKLDTHEDMVYQKFSNNPTLKQLLLDTDEKKQFECTMDRSMVLATHSPKDIRSRNLGTLAKTKEE